MTITIGLVLATVCVAILVTAGQTAAGQARVIDQIDSAGTRLIALSDDGGKSGMLPSAPGQIRGWSDVSWAMGLGEAVDITNPALPLGHAAARVLVGGLPPEIAIIQGRAPMAGEAVVGSDVAATLNLGPGLGRIQAPGQDPVGVVGVFAAAGPLAHLNNLVLIAADPDGIDTLRYIYVMAADVSVVDRIEGFLATSTPAQDPTALTIETPAGAIALRNAIAEGLGATARNLMALIMGVGAVVIAVTMLIATIPRRPEFGRRRALGATRSALVAGLLIQTLVASVPGVALGTVIGLVALHLSTGSTPTWQFTTGVVGLVVILALVASAPVAVVAARLDPLRILRVP
jgi:putative ABC transport system permease protein